MLTRSLAVALLVASPALAQTTNDPFPEPIEATEDVIRVNYVEFARIPDIGGEAPRLMTLVDEPGTRRIFVSDMRGIIYSVSYDGRTVTPYLDLTTPQWGVPVQSQGRERGLQSFAFHPQFAQQGAPGYGKFYTWLDTSDTTRTPDFRPSGGTRTHDTILLEWTAGNPASPTYEGEPPRELMRLEQPFANHNAGHISFRTGAAPGDPDYGLLYMGVADGGSGGDPLDMAQNLGSAFGKIFRIDPLGTNSTNGKYGIPADNRWASDNDPDTLGEIYAYGIRNPQRFEWDVRNGNLFMADVGQNTIEKISLVPSGGNLGWNDWEGSFRYVGREGVSPANPRSDPSITYPVVEYAQPDPLLMSSSAASGVQIYRGTAIPQLANLVIWGDQPSGEIFYIDADDLPEGGQDSIRRILFNDDGQPKTLLQLVQAKNAEQGREPATRTDMRLGRGPDGQIMVLNKYDGIVRAIVP